MKFRATAILALGLISLMITRGTLALSSSTDNVLEQYGGGQSGAYDTPPVMMNSEEIITAAQADNSEVFQGDFFSQPKARGIGIDLYSTPDFDSGLVVRGDRVAMKFGGFVKTDFIYDFDPIDATDSFVTPTIPIGAAPRTNSRIHARSTRFSFETRWAADEKTIRI